MAASLQELLKRRPLVADGAMGTTLRERLGHGHEDDDLELLNLEAPDLVRAIHDAYVAAGADIVQANSYGANPLQFARLGREDLMGPVNAAAVALAREAARTAGRPVLVAGSLGPLGALRYEHDVMRTDAIAAVYAKQMAALAEAGVDFLVLETMDDFREITGALRAARKLGLPVLLQVACVDGETVGGRIDLAAVVGQAEALGAVAVGANCRVGPSMMLDIARRLVGVSSLPVSIQPNAGNYVVDAFGRLTVAGDTAQYREMARACLRLGVRILGGCCYTTPEHIRCARSSVDDWIAEHGEHTAAHPTMAQPSPAASAAGRGVMHDALAAAQATAVATAERTATAASPRRVPSRLERALATKPFVICVEVDPPTDEECRTDPGILGQKIDGVRYLEQRCGVDVITVADHTMGQPWLDPFPFAEAIRPHMHRADLLLHYSCRNKAETDITGNFASYRIYGYKNILIITGDRPRDPDTKSFFVYSSPTLLERIEQEHGGYFFLAASFDHTRGMERGGTLGLDAEVRRLQRKIAAGSRLVLTQPVFSDRVALLREKTRDLGVPIFPGVMPIMSASHARNLNANFPGMHIPEWVVGRQEAAGEDRKRRAKVAVEIATETARQVKALGFPGVYLIMSLNRFDVIKEVIDGVRG